MKRRNEEQTSFLHGVHANVSCRRRYTSQAFDPSFPYALVRSDLLVTGTE